MNFFRCSKVHLYLLLFLASSIFALALTLTVHDSSSAKAMVGLIHDTTGDTAKAKSEKLVNVESGSPRIFITNPETGQPEDLEVVPGAPIGLNGEAAKLSELKPNDEIVFHKNADGLVDSIIASRTISGIILGIKDGMLQTTSDYVDRKSMKLSPKTQFNDEKGAITIGQVRSGDHVSITYNKQNEAILVNVNSANILMDFWKNFKKNLFKPLLLFFYLGFAITLLRIPFEFPHAVYQGLTIYLLLAIGWHGGEELAQLSGAALTQAAMYMVVGFITNLIIGFIAYFVLRRFIPRLRRIDAATVAAYYGSDSAGTFVTCLGVLQVAAIKYAAYMPVMLAVMEIPGCLVGLLLASRLRHKGMDKAGNMPDEPNYISDESNMEHALVHAGKVQTELHLSGVHHVTVQDGVHSSTPQYGTGGGVTAPYRPIPKGGFLNPTILREIFLNPGIFLLLGGILIGFLSRLQGANITAPDDTLFVSLFQGILCLFLLEMGMNAARRLRDLKTAGGRFVAFALIAPNIFACIGILVTAAFSHITNQPLQLGTYLLFAVLCSAASYIAVPAIQRLAIPEASPTLPLAASLGVTFTYNVTVGIPLYLALSEALVRNLPVV